MEYRLIKKVENPKYSFILPISRDWAILEIFKYLHSAILPYEETEMVFYVDEVRMDVLEMVYMQAGLLQMAKKFNGMRIYTSGTKPYDDNFVVEARRKRIIRNWNEIKGYLSDTEITMGLEDDTIPPFWAYKELRKEIEMYGKGFAQGIEAGRWGIEYIGAHRIKTDWQGQAEEVETIEDPGQRQVEIQGGGFYCFATKTKLIKEANFRDEAECLGPDVNFVLDIHRKGYECSADGRIRCTHLRREGKPIEISETITKVGWKKENGIWKRTF